MRCILTQATGQNQRHQLTGGRTVNLVGRRSFLQSIPGAMLLAAAPQSQGEIPNRPKLPGTLSLRARRRTKEAGVSEQTLLWPVARTAIVICDMWDTHTCSMSAQRVTLMAPRMN